MSERVGNSIGVYSGHFYWPMSPRASEVQLADIAHSLSLKCRWGGHCDRFYSVLRHSIRVGNVAAYLWEEENLESSCSHTVRNYRLVQVYGFLHDAHEAYLADIPRPLKPFLDWKKYEVLNDIAIYSRFGLTYPVPTEIEKHVKKADNLLLSIEAVEQGRPLHEGESVTVAECYEAAAYDKQIPEGFREEEDYFRSLVAHNLDLVSPDWRKP